MSFWTIGSADVYLLSRFVSDADLGVYTLASRVGFIAAFLPQGIPRRHAASPPGGDLQVGRGAVRARRAAWPAPWATSILVCVSAVLAMVLLAPLAVRSLRDSFEDAAPLIALTAAAMVWPALLRIVNQQTSWPGRTKATFIGSAVVACLIFIGVTVALAPVIDTYAALVQMSRAPAACRSTCSSAASRPTGSGSRMPRWGPPSRWRS